MSIKQGGNTIAGTQGISGKANVALDNITNAGKEVCANMSMPSNRYINLTLGADNTTYTAPADGFIYLNKVTSTGGQRIGLFGPEIGSVIYSTAAQALGVYIPVSKGDVVTIRYTAAGAVNGFIFVYANGAQ